MESSHIDDVVKKVNKRLYFLKQLKCAKVACKNSSILDFLDIIKNSLLFFISVVLFQL